MRVTENVCSKQQVSDEQDAPIRILLPFKDQKSANAVRNQLSDLSRKINASLVHGQFMEYLIRNNKLAVHQSGNRKLHSTETALLYVTDHLLQAMDSKQLSIMVFLDTSKAFDSIRHNIYLVIKATKSRLFPGCVGLVLVLPLQPTTVPLNW